MRAGLKRKQTSLRHFSDGRDENNWAEFPIALLSDTSPAGQKTIDFEDTLHDWATGQVITRRVSITGSDKYGLPTAKDEEVLLALLQLTKIANNFSAPEVWFVKRQVIEVLGWQNRGWAYDRVEESLHRWKGVSIHYWNAWRDKATGSWCDSAAIGIIDYFTLSDGRLKRSGEAREGWSRFSWNKLFFESFEAGYLKKLDFEMYRRLRRPGAKRALRFLDKRFFHSAFWEFDLRQFACEKLGFSRAYTTGQLKERLRPVMGELESEGFIEPVSYRKERPKVWKIAISKKGKTESDSDEFKPPSSDESLVAELIRRGVAPETSTELVASCPAERVREKLRVFDWLVTRHDKRISKNAPGWLATAIRKDYPLPRDYLRAVNHLKPAGRRVTSQKVRSMSAAPCMEIDRNQCDPEARAIEEYLASLSEEELLKLEAAALEKADAVLVDGYQRSKSTASPAHTAYRRMLLERQAKLLCKSMRKAE